MKAFYIILIAGWFSCNFSQKVDTPTGESAASSTPVTIVASEEEKSVSPLPNTPKSTEMVKISTGVHDKKKRKEQEKLADNKQDITSAPKNTVKQSESSKQSNTTKTSKDPKHKGAPKTDTLSKRVVDKKEELPDDISAPATKNSNADDNAPSETSTEEPPHLNNNHSVWDGLLKKYVTNNGVVNYSGFKSEIGSLNAYLETLKQGVDPSASRDAQLAFWINAYNAFTVKLILNNYPVNSIMDLHNGKPWEVQSTPKEGKSTRRNNSGNDLHRPTVNGPLSNFAVNCAAKSGPPIHNRAFTADNLNSTLESLTKKFMNNAQFNQISGSSLKVSQIFNWYGVDFGDVKAYINKYTAADVSGASLDFSEYDWALNN